MIYTMNVPKEMDYFNGEDQLAIMRGYLTNIFGECEALYAYDTKQFKQYSAYVNNNEVFRSYVKKTFFKRL